MTKWKGPKNTRWCEKCKRVIESRNTPKSFTSNWIRTWWNEEETICYNCGKRWF